MAISSYSTTAGSNTSISGIDIAEGCAPSGINNAIRQMMADIASGAVTNQVPTTTGSANAYAVTLAPAPASLSTGLIVTAVANFANTGAATINVNTLGAKNIYQATSSGPAALSGGEIQVNQVFHLQYDGTQFQLVSPAATSLTSATGLTASSTATLTNKTYDTAGTGNSFKINGTSVSAVLGAGSVLLGGSAALNQVVVQTFTANGTYTPTSGMKYCIIECWGGGGGGGGIAGSATNAGGGGGGGAGSYSRKIATAATIGASQTVTIGAAGTAGTAGNNSGGNGGDTSVGTICIGKGGSGGSGSAGSGAVGGNGGTTGTGDLTTIGMYGTNSIQQAASATGSPGGCGGYGGSTALGSGGSPGFVFAGSGTAAAGSAGTGKGTGGGGGSATNVASNAAGGAGTAGYVIITEFVNA